MQIRERWELLVECYGVQKKKKLPDDFLDDESQVGGGGGGNDRVFDCLKTSKKRFVRQCVADKIRIKNKQPLPQLLGSLIDDQM